MTTRDGDHLVSVCVLRLTRLGSRLRISVSVKRDATSQEEPERFETVDLEEAVDAVRRVAHRLLD